MLSQSPLCLVLAITGKKIKGKLRRLSLGICGWLDGGYDSIGLAFGIACVEGWARYSNKW